MDEWTDMTEPRNWVAACTTWQWLSTELSLSTKSSITTNFDAVWRNFGRFDTFGAARYRKMGMHQNGTIGAVVPPLLIRKMVEKVHQHGCRKLVQSVTAFHKTAIECHQKLDTVGVECASREMALLAPRANTSVTAVAAP